MRERRVYIRINFILFKSIDFYRSEHFKECTMSASNPVADSIKFSIIKNGFPGKAVRLPFRPIYDSCKQNDTALADVLEHLKDEGVLGAMEGDYIVFRSPEKAVEAARAREAALKEDSGADDSSWWSKLSGLGDLSAMAREAMAKLTPEQLAEIKQRVLNMSGDEKKNIMKMMSEMMNFSKGKK